MTTAAQAIYSKATSNPLTAQDRCDRCGAPALAQVFMEAGNLLFCRHHLEHHKPVLMEKAQRIHDYTAAITKEAR